MVSAKNYGLFFRQEADKIRPFPPGVVSLKPISVHTWDVGEVTVPKLLC